MFKVPENIENLLFLASHSANDEDARHALIQTLFWAKDVVDTDCAPENFCSLTYLEYLDGLGRIFFKLDAKQYQEACSEVHSYLLRWPANQRRIRDGLVLALEQIENGG